MEKISNGLSDQEILSIAKVRPKKDRIFIKKKKIVFLLKDSSFTQNQLVKEIGFNE